MTTPAVRVTGLTKRHGDQLVVDDVSFDVRPSTVTCLAGPNGAGKSSTLRLVAGLDRPTAGEVAVHGRPLRSWDEPGRVLGAAFDGASAHPGRTALDSLRWVAHLAGVPQRRCAELLQEVGLGAVAHRRTGKFSLGMHRRLALAVALLPDPEVLVLDEPLNGLDPEGVAWFRSLLQQLGAVAHRRTGKFSLGMHRRLALAVALLPDPEVLVLDEPLNGLDPEGVAWFRSLLQDLRSRGRTVLMVSHAMADVADLVDDVITLREGRVDGSGSASQVWQRLETVEVRTEDPQRLAAVLQSAGGRVVRVDEDFAMHIGGLETGVISRLASEHGLILSGGRSHDS